MNSRLVVNEVVREDAVVLQLHAAEDQALLAGRETCLLCDKVLKVFHIHGEVLNNNCVNVVSQSLNVNELLAVSHFVLLFEVKDY